MSFKSRIKDYKKELKTKLSSGDIDDVCLVIIKANEELGISHIPGFEKFDIMAVHIIKAALVATKLMSDNGEATLRINQKDNSNEKLKPFLKLL